MTDKQNAPITDEHRKLVQELNRNLNVATQCQRLANRDRDVESRAVAAAYRAAAEPMNNLLECVYQADAAEDTSYLKGEAIDAARKFLLDGPADAQAALDKTIREARLDEARWWEHLVGYKQQLEGKLANECEADCMYCQRIAALENPPQGATR